MVNCLVKLEGRRGGSWHANTHTSSMQGAFKVDHETGVEMEGVGCLWHGCELGWSSRDVRRGRGASPRVVGLFHQGSDWEMTAVSPEAFTIM